MTLEEVKGNLVCENDKFPEGMRILAVDDDRTWLRILDELLRKCQYQVTTTNQAKTALKMLRDNKNWFDLVISDVHMPDMDGFKLLELVGLEMDLPVIMLSANSDPKLVMKGISHGACDYLVKPVRIEELKNIWQHVIRRKKFDLRNENNPSTHDKGQQGNGEGGEGGFPDGTADQNRKVNRKRKEDEEEQEEGVDGYENEDPATQKKPRVVWSIELHRKFVAAVNQLGIEKAVPKRILDMMSVDGLTRENVASHLQKYRLYLKRISSVATQQANMVAALGGNDSSYLRTSSLDEFGDFRTFAGSGRYYNSPMVPYQTGGLARRLTSLGKFQPAVWPLNQDASVFEGIPAIGQLQPSGVSGFNENFHSAFQLNNYSLRSEPFDHDRLPPNTMTSNNSTDAHIQNIPLHFSSTNYISTPTEDSRGEISFQEGLVGNVVRNLNHEMAKRWQSSEIFSTFDCVVPADGVVTQLSQNLGQNNGVFHRNCSATTLVQHSGIEKSLIGSKSRPHEDYTLEQTKSRVSDVDSSYDSLDDVMNALIKQEQGPMSLDGEFGFGAYTFE